MGVGVSVGSMQDPLRGPEPGTWESLLPEG